MPEWFTVIAAVIALGGGTFGAVNGYRTMKRTSPSEEIKSEFNGKWQKFYSEKWDKLLTRMESAEETIRNVDSERTRARFDDVEQKLNNDNKRIGDILGIVESQRRFLGLLLKSQQAALDHMSTGNHTGTMKDLSKEIQDFLIKEATR